jgi:hypothetical protein
MTAVGESTSTSETSATPVEGGDAGPAKEYWARRKLEVIESTHARAAALYDTAQNAAATSPNEAEEAARQALRAAAEAYWYAEETDGAGAEHMYLHEIGKWTRKTFACELDWNGTDYTTKCPVKIADERWGSSPGFVARRWCSICYQDLSECLHRHDRLYWVTGGPTASGPCRVCTKDECEHDPGELYAAGVVSIVKEVDEVTEISIVDVPAQPLARPTEVVVRTSALRRDVRRAFPSAPASCDHCLRPYHGLPKPKDWSHPFSESLTAPSDTAS